MSLRPLLAVIPARGGSKGLPGKNIRDFLGLPLIAHSIRLSNMCPEIARCVVSTDSEEIAGVARRYGAEVPFIRPAELAQDGTAMWPVLQHALREVERIHGTRYGSLVLLDPTSPGRVPVDVSQAFALLEEDPRAVGVVGVSEPHFNPRWVCVEEVGGYMRQLVPMIAGYVRRQDVPITYRVNGSLYLWRREHVLSSPAPAYYTVPHRILVIPEERAIHIDELRDFQIAELLVRQGIVHLPWIQAVASEPKQ